VLLTDVEQIETMDHLNSIRLQRTQFENQALFHQLIEQEGIQVEGFNTEEETIIFIP